MNKNEFNELAWNNPRDAIMALWGMVDEVRTALSNLAERLDDVQTSGNGNANEIDALQATVVELSTVVNALAEPVDPVEEPEAA